MGYLLYLMFRCDRRCDGKFGNFVGTKHTQKRKGFDWTDPVNCGLPPKTSELFHLSCSLSLTHTHKTLLCHGYNVIDTHAKIMYILHIIQIQNDPAPWSRICTISAVTVRYKLKTLGRRDKSTTLTKASMHTCSFLPTQDGNGANGLGALRGSAPFGAGTGLKIPPRG